MSTFFTLPTSQRKRKRPQNSDPSPFKRSALTKRKPQGKYTEDDESIPSDEDSDAGPPGTPGSEDASSDDEDVAETAAERRLKLAEQYLENIRQEVGEEQEVGFDAADVDRELIAARLKEDVAEEKGRLHRYIAQRLDLRSAQSSFFRTDTLATTAVAVCPPYAYTTSKDLRLIKWELAEPASTESSNSAQAQTNGKRAPRPQRKKPKQLIYTCGDKNKRDDITFQHHTAPILCVAASADGKFVATGGADRRMIVWDATTLEPLKIFSQHRDSVMSLAFRGKTNQLFSASKDRTVKIWSLDELAYVETLFGHQDEVVDVAAVGGTQERCVSVGARDRTARLWKVVEESQLVFRGGGAPGSSSKRKDGKGSKFKKKPTLTNGTNGTDADTTSEILAQPTFNEGSLDRVIQIDTQLFVTGSDSGALSLFSLHKKKPLHVLPLAHGWDAAPPASASSADVDAEPSLSGIRDTTVSNGGINSQTASQVTGHQPTSHASGPHANAYNAQPTPRWITALKAIPYTDLFVSGSWDGYVRVWRITAGGDKGAPYQDAASTQRRIEPVGVLGDRASVTSIEVNGMAKSSELAAPIQTIINDLSIFCRGTRGEDGVSVVAALGTETRLGRWKKMDGHGRKGNGACVWELPLVHLTKASL